MIILPKYKDIVMESRASNSVCGFYRLTKGKGQIITGDTGWFPNIVTNLGLNGLAATNFAGLSAYAHVGTGTNTEAATDTALQTFTAATNSTTSNTDSIKSSAPYYAYNTRTFRFNPGFAGSPGNVNIAEVGLSSQATTGQLFSRARVKDSASPQAPTTITVLGDEWLDVSYEFRHYPDHVLANGSPDDGTGTVTIAGAGSPEVFGYTIRPGNITNSTNWKSSTLIAQGDLSLLRPTVYAAGSTIGAVTSTPSGSSDLLSVASGSSFSNGTYSADTYNRDITLTVGLTDGNTAGGIGALLWFTYIGCYQVVFDAPIPKDATKVWTFVMNAAWTRATI